MRNARTARRDRPSPDVSPPDNQQPAARCYRTPRPSGEERKRADGYVRQASVDLGGAWKRGASVQASWWKGKNPTDRALGAVPSPTMHAARGRQGAGSRRGGKQRATMRPPTLVCGISIGGPGLDSAPCPDCPHHSRWTSTMQYRTTRRRDLAADLGRGCARAIPLWDGRLCLGFPFPNRGRGTAGATCKAGAHHRILLHIWCSLVWELALAFDKIRGMITPNTKKRKERTHHGQFGVQVWRCNAMNC